MRHIPFQPMGGNFNGMLPLPTIGQLESQVYSGRLLAHSLVPLLTVVPMNGTSAPVSTPSYVGQFFVDTMAKKLYFAAGIASSADWVLS